MTVWYIKGLIYIKEDFNMNCSTVYMSLTGVKLLAFSHLNIQFT